MATTGAIASPSDAIFIADNKELLTPKLGSLGFPTPILGAWSFVIVGLNNHAKANELNRRSPLIWYELLVRPSSSLADKGPRMILSRSFEKHLTINFRNYDE